MTNFDVITPVDGSVYLTRQHASDEELSATLARARLAAESWRKTPLSVRQGYCRDMLKYFDEHRSDIALELSWQMGRPLQYAAGELDGLAERALHMIDSAEEALQDIRLPEKEGFKRFIKRVPHGVCAVIAPWNYPYLTAVNAIVPALLAGNVVILKHSAQTPLCAERFDAAFRAASLPEGVFQFLHLSHQQTEQLISAEEVRHISFTGSVEGGRMVENNIAGQFKSAGLELGGKDPAYVRSDANLGLAAETVVDGAFFNSGQSCCGIERAYVHADVFDDFVEQARRIVETYLLDRPDRTATSLGPMVRASAAEFVRAQVADAVAAGAIPLIDESLFVNAKANSPYLAPQLLINVDHSMRLMTEETFGPVLGIQRVESDGEALELMNDSDLGLTAAIFTQDHEKGQELAEQLEAGTVFINRCDYLDPGLAWTGVKNSGKGCSLSSLAYEHLTRPKSFHFKTVD